jgi:hypothetical protein
MTYLEKLRDPRWQQARLRIMERDGFACRDCGDAASPLQIHHCHYRGEPWEASPLWLLTLCERCHAARGSCESDAKAALGVLFAGMTPAALDALTATLLTAAQRVAKDEGIAGVMRELIVFEREGQES